MEEELIDICDSSNRLTGLKNTKTEAHKNGLWHRSSHVWLYTKKGEILLQLRGKNQFLYPDRWDISVAGHVSAGEEPITGAIREMKEEIGLFTRKQDLHFFKIRKVRMVYKRLLNNEFNYIYFRRFDGNIKKLKIQKEELQKIRFMPLDMLEKELKANPGRYVPHGRYWHEIIREVRKRLKPCLKT